MVIDEEAYPVIAHDGLMTILIVILPIAGLFLAFLLMVWLTYGLARIRALRTPPIGYNEGMVVNKKTGQLIGTKTAVHFDYVTGRRFFGKTVYEC